MTEPAHRGTERARGPWWRGASHIFALSGFAFAQPVFEVLGRNPSFFVAHGNDASGVILFAVGLAVVPPTIIIGGLAFVRMLSRQVAAYLHVAVIGTLAATSLLPYLSSAKVGTIVTVGIFVLVGTGLALAYSRFTVARRYATVLVAAPVLFVVLFLTTSSVRTLLFDAGSDVDVSAVRARSRTPVVVLLMDEFAQGSMLEPGGSIDAKRFPNFGRLARGSTWYPNATTQSNATNIAVPTILTGRYPRLPSPPPVHASYPNNLFSLVGTDRSSVIREWVTALCPMSDCGDRGDDYSSKHLAADTALVYMHAAVPDRLKGELPPLGLQWAGFFANPADNDERIARFPSALRPAVRAVMNWLEDDEFRASQAHRFRRFVRALDRREAPMLSFLHVGLPHTPWHLLPNTKPYNRQDTPGIEGVNSRWTNETFADAGLQRYMLQVKAMDTLLGELTDTLQHRGRWDRSLVVVLADHGVSFDAGHSTRAILGSEGEVLPIPLFVKYPQQDRGRVDDRNAELIDVLPTVADVLGIEVPWEVDGSSLAGPDPGRADKRVFAATALPPYPVDVAESKTAFAARIRALFGNARKNDDLFAFGPGRSLVGESIGRLRIGVSDELVQAHVEDAWRWASHDPNGGYVPARPAGTLRGRPPPWIAVALNGTIAGTGRPWLEGGTWRFEVMVSDRYLVAGRNELRIFGIDDDGTVTRIETV